MGFKAPLAYSSSFYFVCRKNGVERKYMMYEGEDVNTIDLLYETPTEECNGVKIIVPVIYSDRYEFVKKIKEQLAYFESVYFDVDGISNDFVIFRGEHFQYSEICEDKSLHICLDNVYYPIDFSKLGIEKIYFPVALRFGLSDGIFPIPNREAIKMTKEAKDTILNKIGLIADHFVTKFNEQIQDSDDIRAVFTYYDSYQRMIKGFKENTYLDIKDLRNFSNISIKAPKIKNVNVLNLDKLYVNKSFILGEYTKKYELNRGVFRECKRYWDMDISYNDLLNKPCYIFSYRIPGIKKEYLKAITPKSEKLFFIKKTSSFKLGKLSLSIDVSKYYVSLLQLKHYPKDQWRTCIKEFQYILSLIFKKVIDLDTLEIPQDWLDERKRKKDALKVKVSIGRRQKLEGEVSGKRAEKLERFVQGKNSKLVPIIYKLENIHRQKGLIVYGGNQDADKMDKLYSVFSAKASFVVFSDRELKILEKVSIHNLIPLNKFMEGKNKPFKRIVTAYLIDQFINKNKTIFNKKDRFSTVSTDIYNKLVALEKYRNLNHQRGSEKIYQAMLEIANEHNLFDVEMLVVYKEIESLFAKLPFLTPLFNQINSYSDHAGVHLILCDLFKYYKQKINWKNYKLVLNEEPTEELTETVVEDLVEN